MLLAVGIGCGVIKLITLEYITPQVKSAQKRAIETSFLVLRNVKRIEKCVILNLVLMPF